MRNNALLSSFALALFPLAFALSGCSDDAGSPTQATPPVEEGVGGEGNDEGGAGGDTDGAGGSGGSGGEEPVGCERLPKPAEAERFVVTGHGHGEDGPEYRVLRLSTGGALATTEERFVMGTPGSAPIVFTPDGVLGFAPQDDGTVGVFRVDASGKVEVLHSDFGKDVFYAERLAMAPSGDHFYAIDVNWPNNGGGLYRVDIGCDDTLTVSPRIIEGKNTSGMLFLGENEAFVATRQLGPDTEEGETVHRMALADPPSVTASLNLFGEDDAFISALAMTRNGKHVIVGENNEYRDGDNRIGFVDVSGTGLTSRGLSTKVDDPTGIAVSPFDDAILVTSGYGNRVYVFDYDPSATEAPFTFRGEVEGAKPQLPGALVAIERGPLDGRVFIPVVDGIVQLQFKEGGVIEDLGLFSVGSGLPGIVSNLGVQP